MEGEFVCSHCLLPVTKVREIKKVWTRDEPAADRWFHTKGGQVASCGKQFLAEDEIEEVGDPGPTEVSIQD